MKKFESQFDNWDRVEFRYKEEGEYITAKGVVVAVRFTKAKVFYDIIDDYYAYVYRDIESDEVKELVV